MRPWCHLSALSANNPPTQAIFWSSFSKSSVMYWRCSLTASHQVRNPWGSPLYTGGSFRLGRLANLKVWVASPGDPREALATSLAMSLSSSLFLGTTWSFFSTSTGGGDSDELTDRRGGGLAKGFWAYSMPGSHRAVTRRYVASLPRLPRPPPSKPLASCPSQSAFGYP
jgi:hypothetical protein